MFRLLFFFFLGGVQAIFDCQETSTTLSGEGCHFQFFTDVGPDFNCSNTFVWESDSYLLLSMEMIDIHHDDTVTVSWDDTTLSHTGDSFSFQDYVYSPSNSLTIHVKSSENSTMKGTYALCPRKDNQSIPIDKESVHYGGEAFVLQEFPAANGVGPNFVTPHKWELTAEVKGMALMIDDLSCSKCRDLIWVYNGTGKDAQFLGTTQRSSYITTGTLTFYFVDKMERSDRMALIFNEQRNDEQCAFVGYSFWHYTNTDPVKTNRVKRGAWSTTCETVVNQCYNDGTCDNIAVYNGTAASPDLENIVYAGAIHPNPREAGLVLFDYNSATLSPSQLPQTLFGNIRSFVRTDGGRIGVYGTGNHDPRIGRKGYVSTAFYPFYHASKSWGDLSFSVASYPYKITLTIANSSVEADDEAFFDFFKNGQLVERIAINNDSTVLGSSYTYNVETGFDSRIFLFGGTGNFGSLVNYEISEGVDPPTTRTTTTTTTRGTTTSPHVVLITTAGTPAKTTSSKDGVSRQTGSNTRAATIATTPKEAHTIGSLSTATLIATVILLCNM